MKKVVLAGNSVTAEIINSYLQKDKRYEVVGATVDEIFMAQGGASSLHGSATLAGHATPAWCARCWRPKAQKNRSTTRPADPKAPTPQIGAAETITGFSKG